MTKKIGLIRKKFLTRERLYLIVDYLTRAEKSKHWTVNMRKQWKLFLSDLDNNIMKLYYDLRYCVWKPSPFLIFKRRENGKLRIIYASLPVEQIVDNLYTDCINYVFLDKKKLVPANCYGSIKGKGQHELRSLIIRKVRHRTDLFVGIGDTSKYYPSMNHCILFRFLSDHIKDKWLLWLSEVNINRMGDVGIALGLPSSNPIGHVYHACLDWLILLDYRVRRYYRFCDDKFIIHKDVNYLHSVMRIIRKEVDGLGQKLKSNWRVVNCSNERFECLGASINSHNARLRTSSRRRIERMIKLRMREPYNPMKAFASWAGVKGSLKGLDVRNLINYWRRVYPDFFNLLDDAIKILDQRRRNKKWHNRLYNILKCAPDNRSDKNKMLYPHGTCDAA